MDFAFLGGEEDPQKSSWPNERTSNMIMSAAAPQKTTGTYIGSRHGDMVVKSDQEPALRSIVEDVERFKNVGRQRVVRC